MTKPESASAAVAAPNVSSVPATPPVAQVSAEPGFQSNQAKNNLTAAESGGEVTQISVERRCAVEPPADGLEKRVAVVDRRAHVERRTVDIGSPTGLERRRGPGRRRTEERRSAEEGNMSDEQFEFVLAIDTYKRLNNRPFPSWTEILEVIKQLGYRKVAASTLTLQNSRASSALPPPAPATPVSALPPSDFLPG